MGYGQDQYSISNRMHPLMMKRVFLTITTSTEKNLDTTLLMQSSQRPMKESLLEALAPLMLGLVRIIELRISKAIPLQSNSSVEVVKKCSLPWGNSLYTSLLSGKRSSSGGGSCKYHDSSNKLGSAVGGTRRHPTLSWVLKFPRSSLVELLVRQD